MTYVCNTIFEGKKNDLSKEGQIQFREHFTVIPYVSNFRLIHNKTETLGRQRIMVISSKVS